MNPHGIWTPVRSVADTETQEGCIGFHRNPLQNTVNSCVQLAMHSVSTFLLRKFYAWSSTYIISW